jgi:5'-nucleotidase
MTKIFISYRREDSQWPVDRLRLALRPYVANPDEDIFVDIDNIPVGVDFVDYIGQQVGSCEMLLAVIGPRWLTVTDAAGGRRLDDPGDFVRLEIAAALKRSIPVVPVLIGDTKIPTERELPDDIKALARRNGVGLRRETFEADAERLIARLRLPVAGRAKPVRIWRWLLSGLGVAAMVAALIVFWPLGAQDTTHGETASVPHSNSPTVEVHLLAINDFHGALDPPGAGTKVLNPDDPTAWKSVPGGGSARLAAVIAKLSKRPNTIMVAAGDLVGSSPLLSSLFHDEPTIEALSQMGLALSAVGNHEFDEGAQELRRMQDGGCHPTDGCLGAKPFEGARFQYLAASTFLDNGETLFPPYAVREFDGVKVGFIGLTLEGAADLLTPTARAGLTFKDEAETVNALVPKLKAEGVEAIVVLLHEGGNVGGPDDCENLSGPVTEIVPRFDKAVDVVVTGHTHGIYTCTIDDRLVTSAGSFGTRVTDISLIIDRKTGDVMTAKAEDIAIRQDLYDEDPQQLELIDGYRRLADATLNRPVGSIAATISRDGGTTGESALGGIVADAILHVARKEAGKVDIAFVNPGGIRADLAYHDGGRVTFLDLMTVQPFQNDLFVLSFTGAEIEAILKQQSQPGRNVILQVSNGFSFAWRQTPGQPMEIVPGSTTLNGQPLDPKRIYRVVINAFLAAGGDGFSGFKAGRDRSLGGVIDVEALHAWFNAYAAPSPKVPGRIIRAD